jgi:predicted nucleic acid-binding protein
METSFLDTSALVKRYHVEEGTAEIDRIFDDPDHGLVVSRLGFVEMLSALAMKVRAGNLSSEDHELARKRFLGDVKSRRVSVLRMLVGHFRDAERLVERYAKTKRFRTLDALQLGVVIELRRLGRVDAFVCADEVLCEVARLEGVTTINPAAVI